MTERTSQREYIPGLGKNFLTPLYDVVHRVFGIQSIHEEMITLAGLRAGHRVLDVGCATGNLLRTAGRRHPSVELAGLDPDPAALARAGRKARRAGLTVRLDRGFAQDLPHPDASLDRVFSSLMLHPGQRREGRPARRGAPGPASRRHAGAGRRRGRRAPGARTDA